MEELLAAPLRSAMSAITVLFSTALYKSRCLAGGIRGVEAETKIQKKTMKKEKKTKKEE